jgi:hypothetical protein
MPKEELLRNLTENPADTPIWINSQIELQRRLEERLTIWTRTLAISTIILAICTVTDVILHVLHYAKP